MPGQRLEVGCPFAERRDMHRDDADSVIKIITEFFGLDHLPQIAVGRSDQAHVHRHVHVPAERPHHALLKDAQQLHLHAEAGLADLVEE